LVSVITNIGLDHTQFLGDTLAKIAAEKAGIIKENAPVIIGRVQVETTKTFATIAQSRNTEVIYAELQPHISIDSDLKGIYQAENKKTAYYALQQLPEELRPDYFEIQKGFQHVVKNTGLLGRWQTLSENPPTICDTGHNEDGIKQVLRQIEETEHKNLHMVWGMVNDKDVAAILKMLPKKASYYFARPNLPRGLPAEILFEEAKKLGLKGNHYTSVLQALLTAQENAASNDLIFIGGSTFVVAEVV
jgi:dihydrofolate synthase/folylpolyglutamate synthase